MSVDFFHPLGRPCFLYTETEENFFPLYYCVTENLDPKMVDMLLPEKILSIEDISFLPKNDNPVAKSHPMLCTTNAVFLANMYKEYMFVKQFNLKSIRVLFYLNDFESVKWELEANP